MSPHRLTVTCDDCGSPVPPRWGIVNDRCVFSGYCACGFLTPVPSVPDLRLVTGAPGAHHGQTQADSRVGVSIVGGGYKN
jgi:hypothetical protein